MEDFSNILWGLLIGGSIIASIVSKNKEEKQKKNADNADGELFPQEFQSEMPQRLPHERTLRTTPNSQSKKEFGGLTEELEAYKKHVEQHRTPKSPAEKTATQSSSQSAMKASATISSVVTDAEHPSEAIMGDFDLRKAVVWSEILKPKFDEE